MVQTDLERAMEEIGSKTCITGYHHFWRLASRSNEGPRRTSL